MNKRRRSINIWTVILVLLLSVSFALSGCGSSIPGLISESDPTPEPERSVSHDDTSHDSLDSQNAQNDINDQNGRDNQQDLSDAPSAVPASERDPNLREVTIDGETLYCRQIRLGETFKISDLGEFSFDQFAFTEITDNPNNRYAVKTYSGGLLEFSYYNISTETKKYHRASGLSSSSRNELFAATIIYQNPDNSYFYSESSFGLKGNNNSIVTDTQYLYSLEEYDLAIGFSLPKGLIESKDGLLAVLLEFSEDEQYILMLREDGINQY